MSLLLLFGYANPVSVPISELVGTSPLPGAGAAIQVDAVSGGEWRFALELADPADGDTASWHDITSYYAGDRYQRGGDDYLGRYRASIASVQLQIDDSDNLAPWGQDTTPVFGVDLRLDAGMLMRLAFFRVVAGVVVEWAADWTGRVESWGDATEARGQIRKHIVSVVDTIGDLANVPTQIGSSNYWQDWLAENLVAARWLFGVDYYGDPTVVAYDPDETLVAAINRMDSGSDPGGLVWRSLRSGRLVVHPAPWDTMNVARYTNPLLDVYPDGVTFSYFPDITDVEYIQDDGEQSFGIQRNVAGIINSLIVTWPDGFGTATYPIDDPVSAGRYGIRPFTATWIGSNPQAVDDILAARAYSSAQALPLRTTIDHEGFWPALLMLDQFDPVTVVHATQDDGAVVTATGVIRNIVEERTYRAEGGLSWQSTVQIDIDATDVSPALLPVEDLMLVETVSPGLGGASLAEFSWTNPVQPSITPTEVQLRVLGRSLIWFSEDYPGVGADGTVIGNLEAATAYTFQVRLIRRVNGVIVARSAARSVTFTTPANILPIPIPGDDPTDTNVDMDDLPFDGCEDVSIELQENDGSGWVTVDTFDGAEIEQDADGHWHLVDDIENASLNQDSQYRWVGLCDGDVIVTGEPWSVPDDWDDPCTEPPAVSTPPFDDASLLVYVPQICAPDTIREWVSGIAGVHGDALEMIGALLGGGDQRVLVALADPAWSTTPGGILAYGECPQITGHVGDKSINVRAYVSDAAFCTLFECAAMRITCTPFVGGWKAGGYVVTPTGDQVCLSGVLDLDTEYTITATYEQATGELVLYVDDVQVNAVDFGEARDTVNALPIWRVGAPPESWITDCAIWDSVLPFTPTPPLSDLEAWYDASDSATVHHTGGTVSQWDDKSGNARHMTVSAGLTGPDTGIRSQNGLNVLNFTGVDGLNNTAMGLTLPYTIFAVCVQDTTPGAPFISTVARMVLVAAEHGLRITSTAAEMHAGGGVVSGSAYANGTWRQITGTHAGNGLAITLRENASAVGSSTATTGSAASDLMVGGIAVGGTRTLDGAIAELLIYSTVLGATERDAVEAYLASKWAVP